MLARARADRDIEFHLRMLPGLGHFAHAPDRILRRPEVASGARCRLRGGDFVIDSAVGLGVQRRERKVPSTSRA
eukprot:1324357-Amorphochlora_amoeboformis.AAC.2